MEGERLFMEEIRESDRGERAEGGNVIKGQTTIHIQQRKKHFQTIINGNVNVQGEFVNSYLCHHT